MIGQVARGLSQDTNYIPGHNYDSGARREDTNYIAPATRPIDDSSSDWRGSINPSEIRIHDTIFVNANCTIEKGRHRDLAVIVKRSTNRTLIQREINFHRRAVSSEYIVRFVGWYETELVTALVMQKCSKNLKDWSHARGTSVEIHPMMLAISEGIAKGLAHINSLDIIHNDLKPQNVFVDTFGKPYIGDFGVATSRGESRIGYTKRYFDKESLDVVPDEKSDSWLLGATLWEFWADEPFNVDEEVMLDRVTNSLIHGILKKLLRPRQWRSTAKLILSLFDSTTERSAYRTMLEVAGSPPVSEPYGLPPPYVTTPVDTASLPPIPP
ncbi:Serine/threonine-protein kinase plk1 [Phlyctochytrium bullatum]|nr:Serine/threonine-protein kinase plk1 [Phlyctochytrium bullatum]